MTLQELFALHDKLQQKARQHVITVDEIGQLTYAESLIVNCRRAVTPTEGPGL